MYKKTFLYYLTGLFPLPNFQEFKDPFQRKGLFNFEKAVENFKGSFQI